MDEISDLLKKALVKQTSKKAISLIVGRYLFAASPPVSLVLAFVVPKIVEYVIAKDYFNGFGESSISKLEIELNEEVKRRADSKIKFHMERMDNKI